MHDENAGMAVNIDDSRVRAVVNAVRPAVDGGRFAATRKAGERVQVEADCFTDSHDMLRVVLIYWLVILAALVIAFPGFPHHPGGCGAGTGARVRYRRAALGGRSARALVATGGRVTL